MFEWKLSVNNKRIDLTWSSRQYLNLKIISLFVNVRVDYSEQIKKNVNSYISEKIYQKLNKRLSKHSFFTIEHSIKKMLFSTLTMKHNCFGKWNAVYNFKIQSQVILWLHFLLYENIKYFFIALVDQKGKCTFLTGCRHRDIRVKQSRLILQPKQIQKRWFIELSLKIR